MREDRLTERMPELNSDEEKAYRIKDNGDDISTRLIRGIEELVGVSDDNETWLYDSIDPDALDSIFEQKHDGTPRDDGKVVFTARGCEIVVHGSGKIIIYVPKEVTDE